jgi:hypothetical protein
MSINQKWECPFCDYGYNRVDNYDYYGYHSVDTYVCYKCYGTGLLDYNPYPSDDEINIELQLIAQEQKQEYLEDNEMTVSERQLIADKFADFIIENDLNNPYGGDVVLDKSGKVPCYKILFSKPRVLDGVVSVYSKNWIQVKFQTQYRALPAKQSLVFKSVENALLFIKLAFIDLDFDSALEIQSN